MVARKTENWENTMQVIPRYASNNKKVKKRAWGFSDGNKAYFFHQLEFFEINLSNNKMKFFGYGEYNPNTGTTGYIIAGAIGSSIEHAATIAKIKKQKVEYLINPASGLVKKAMLVAYDDEPEQPDVYIVFFRYDKKELPGSVKVTVNDTLDIVLDNYSYDQIKFKVSREPVKLTMDDGSIELNVDIMNEENKYVEISNNKDQTKEKLYLCDYVTGDFYAKKAKNKQLRREAE